MVINGATSGIGQSIALRYAADGANIVVLNKDSQENRNETARQIATAGGQSLIVSTDVSNFDALREGVDQGVSQFGGIDVLVNNTSATRFTDCMHNLPQQSDLCVATSERAVFFLSLLFISVPDKIYPKIQNQSTT